MRRLRSLAIVTSVLASALAAASPAWAADAPNSRAQATTVSPNGKWLFNTIASSTDVDWYRFRTTSAGLSLITLGDLPANYQLHLYNSAGTVIAGSNRSGKVYEEIYKSLAAGTYFVRVAPVSGASDASHNYALAFRPLGTQLVILSSRAYSDSSNYLHIVGEVVNNSGGARQFTQISATLYNSSGQVVGSDFTFTEHDVVLPYRRSGFDLMASRPAGYHHYRLTVTSDAAGSYSALENLGIHPGVGSTDGIGYRHYPGEVSNPNGFTTKFVEVFGTLYNGRGGVLYTEFTFTDPDTIPSHGSASYDLTFQTTAGTVYARWATEGSR